MAIINAVLSTDFREEVLPDVKRMHSRSEVAQWEGVLPQFQKILRTEMLIVSKWCHFDFFALSKWQ